MSPACMRDSNGLHVIITITTTMQVPLVVLTDAPLSANPAESVSQEAWWGINVTHIEAALSHLLGEGEEVRCQQH